VTADEPQVLWERQGAVGIATLNRPHALNALTVELLEQLEQYASEAERDPDVRALVIAGGGERAFCVGADLKTLDREYEDGSGADKLVDVLHRVYGRLERLGRPVIAAVHGFCLGGGLELTLTADLCVAADDARFGLPEVKVGTLPGAGGTQRLPQLIGARRAKELMFTGELIDAAEAYRVGLVNRVVPAASLLEEATTLAAAIAGQAPLALQKIKEAVDGGLGLDLEAGLALERACHVFLRQTEDRREGIHAFVEKRTPHFVGR
jgi:enoyl-CoA hydratase/carnithine racemase